MPIGRPLTWGRPLIEITDPLEAARHLVYAAYLVGTDGDEADADRPGEIEHHPEEHYPLSVRAAFDRVRELLPE
jgi:hypothetical protein